VLLGRPGQHVEGDEPKGGSGMLTLPATDGRSCVAEDSRVRAKLLPAVVAAVLVVALLVSSLACQPGRAIYNYTLGSANAASTHYVPALVIANIINRDSGDIGITVVESGGTHDNLVKTQAGAFDGGFAVNWDGMAMAYNGTIIDEYIAYGSWPELRMMAGYVHNYVFLVVVDDELGTEIETIYDLHGQKFSAGLAGSVTEFNLRRQLEALGIEPDWVSASYTDAVNMAKSLEIVGFARAVTSIELDSSMLDLQSAVDVKILGWPEEDLDAALLATPGTSATWIPEDALVALPMPGFYTLGHTTGIFVTTDVPQDVGYRMAKAYVDKWDELVRVWPVAASWVPLETDLALLGEIIQLVYMPPLHAGVVQLMKERGYEVPPELIGPEYNSVVE
jgi:uncharacterized protein